MNKQLRVPRRKVFPVSAALILVVATYLSIAEQSQAATLISVNFQGADATALASGDTTGASGYVGSHWNNFTGASGTGTFLNDSTGASTTVALGAYGGSGSTTGIPGTVGNNSNAQQTLFGGGINTHFQSSPSTDFTITGLSAFSSYDIVVYYSGGTNAPTGRTANFTITGSPTIYYVSGISTVNTAYTLSNSTVSGTFASGNYVVWSGLTANTESIRMANQNNTEGIIGFQVNGTAVPEPSTYALLSAGCLALFVLRRRSVR